ncbi:MAG: hypothetical protein JWM16_496 [Verrucomicrobiales bacterium]|nr:hypothetical protein [Verrucomicrobiales bacterium]
MKRNKSTCCWAIVCLWLFIGVSSKADSYPLPDIIKKGFALYAKGGGAPTVEAWRQGGGADLERHLSYQTQGLKQLATPLGNYKTFEVVESKGIGSRSRIYYISIQFERGAIFSSFLVYNTSGTDWVIQRVLFNNAPESIMPWLAVHQEE